MKLSNLKRDLSSTEINADENNTRLRSQLDAVTNDLRSTKVAMEEIQRREKQVKKRNKRQSCFDAAQLPKNLHV